MPRGLVRVRMFVWRRWQNRGRNTKIAFVALIFLAAIGAFSLVAAIPNWFEKRPGLAGWVQAIGALLALAIAIVAPVWQTEETERRARSAELRAAKSVVTMARDIIAQVDERFRTVAKAKRLVRGRYYLARIRHAAAMVEKIDVSQLSDFTTVAHLTNVGGALAALSAIIGGFDNTAMSDEFVRQYEEAKDGVSAYAGSITDAECKGFIDGVERELSAIS
jgi:hypothetical protein